MCWSLAVGAARRPQFARHEVIRRPGTANQNFTVFELPGGARIAVLVTLNRLLVDQVGDVDEHSASVILAAAHVLFEGVKELVHLDGEGTRLGLALAMTSRLFA